jgi:sulfoquinovose isomerase
LWNSYRDSDYGGYYWGLAGPSVPTKQASGHAFVVLAASSAKVAGLPGADRLLTDIPTIILERFWEEQYGAVAEEFTRERQPFDYYRGQNSNIMHLAGSLMAAVETANDSTYLHGGTNCQLDNWQSCTCKPLARS